MLKKKKSKQGKHAAPDKSQKVAEVPEVASEPAGEAALFGQGKHVKGSSEDKAEETASFAAAAEDSDSTIEMPAAALPEDTLFSDAAYAGPTVPGAQFGTEAFEIKKKRKHGKVLAIVAGVLVSILVIAYGAGAYYFHDRFFPNTTAGARDISMLTFDEVRANFAQEAEDYELVLDGQGFSLELSASDAGMSFDTDAVMASMQEDVNMWAWPYEIFQVHDETDKVVATYNQTGLDETIRVAVEEFNADKADPVNATIAFDEELDSFAVVAEQPGTKLDAERVVLAADEALVAFQSDVELTEEHLVQPTVLSDEPALQTAIEQANTMVQADVTLTMAGDVAAEVNGALISQWVSLDENLNATLSQDALVAWVDELAAACNTVGTERSYTRADGKEVTVSGGTYGWEVDHDALLTQVQEAVAAGTVGTQEVPCSSSGTAYNGPGARDWGNRYIDIDLTQQHVIFYGDSGEIIWESDCVTGNPNTGHSTPPGVYKINSGMASPCTLVGRENGQIIYETKVSYWMPFIRNSIGFHDATWQSAFGGERYRTGYGSHGCVNLPLSKSAELYDLVQVGDCVVCHY